MKKTVVLLGLMFFGLGTKAQERDEVHAFRKVLEQAVNYYASDEYRSADACYDEFFTKVNADHLKLAIGYGQTVNFAQWLSDNLSLTQFTTAEEGVQLLYRCEDSKNAAYNKEEELYNQRQAAFQKLTRDEVAEVFDDIAYSYIYWQAQKKVERNQMMEQLTKYAERTAQLSAINNE